MKIILALFDRVAEQYQIPFFVPSIGVAYRSLMDEIARGGEGNMLATHPKDFCLYRLGTYNEENGRITDIGHDPVHILDCESLVIQKEPVPTPKEC